MRVVVVNRPKVAKLMASVSSTPVDPRSESAKGTQPEVQEHSHFAATSDQVEEDQLAEV